MAPLASLIHISNKFLLSICLLSHILPSTHNSANIQIYMVTRVIER